MSRENVERLERALEAAPNDPEPFFALLSPTVEWDMSGVPSPGVDRTVGEDSVREFFRIWAGAFDDWGYEVEETIDADSSVVVAIRQWGRGKESGVPVEHRFFQVWTFEEGKVTRYRGLENRADALKAAGLSAEG